jgi:hypothetical protein
MRDIQTLPEALITMELCMRYDSSCCVQLLKLNILSNLLLSTLQ